MGWPQNPDEYFAKPLTVYPMTNPTPQTPEPPAAGELSDEELLQMAAVALEYDSIAPGEPDVMLVGPEELIAFARAAISADRAQRYLQAEQMAEALRRLWRWGGRHGWDCQTFRDVYDWIDAGMTGPLPPLPEHLTSREVQSNG